MVSSKYLLIQNFWQWIAKHWFSEYSTNKEMNLLIFFWLIVLSTKKRTKKISDLFLIIYCSLHFNKKIDDSNAFKRSIISNLSPRSFSVDAKIALIFLTNQNKFYAITLINRWMNTIWRFYHLLYLLKQNLKYWKHATSYRKRLFNIWRMIVDRMFLFWSLF